MRYESLHFGSEHMAVMSNNITWVKNYLKNSGIIKKQTGA